MGLPDVLADRTVANRVAAWLVLKGPVAVETAQKAPLRLQRMVLLPLLHAMGTYCFKVSSRRVRRAEAKYQATAGQLDRRIERAGLFEAIRQFRLAFELLQAAP